MGEHLRTLTDNVPRRRFAGSFFRNMARRLAAVTAGVLCTLTCLSAAIAGERIALILAAENYEHLKRSGIGVERGNKIADALRARGFQVTVKTDPNNANARAALREFASNAGNADIAYVFLLGHGASSRGRTFFLPTNTQIRRATDLLSRGLTVDSVAHITASAKKGGTFFLMTIADIPTTIQAVAARPVMTTEPAENVTVVFSSSTKVPVSSVDGVSARASDDVIDVLSDENPGLAALTDATSAGGIGLIAGNTADYELVAKPEPVAPPPVEPPQVSEAEKAAEEARRKEAEARASEAEERAREAERRAQEAESRAKAEAERARTAAEQAAAKDVEEKAAASSQKSDEDNIESLRVVEALLGRAQRRSIQRELKGLGLYAGPIDAIFGPQTRDAIKLFQRRNGATETGFLTPDQFQKLVGG